MTNAENYPSSVKALIVDVEAVGGEVREIKPRYVEVALPCKVVGGAVRLVVREYVGWYMQDNGRWMVRGVRAARQELAYWARQSGAKVPA